MTVEVDAMFEVIRGVAFVSYPEFRASSRRVYEPLESDDALSIRLVLNDEDLRELPGGTPS